MSSGDDPVVGDQSGSTLVFELATLVLAERHLPGPLCITGHTAAHYPALAHKLPAADLTVVRVGVEGVECPGPALCRAHIIVIQGKVDLRSVLANVVSEQIIISMTTQCWRWVSPL